MGSSCRSEPVVFATGVHKLRDRRLYEPVPSRERECIIHKIVCRAQVVETCLHEQPTTEAFGEDLPLSEDGTFDGESIVCDPCYIAVMPFTPSGQGLLDELPAAIEAARA